MTRPDLAVVDVETTGFAYWTHDRIVEVGIVRTDFDGNELATFETLVNPRRDVGPTHIHGVTAEMVRGAPPFEAVADAVLELLDGTLLVAHNARFDVNFLRAELARAGDPVDRVPHHCTLRSTRAAFPDLPSKKLERVCEFLDIEIERAHAALSDARATRELLDALRAERPDVGPSPGEPFRPPRPPGRPAAEPLSRRRFEEAREEDESPMRRLLGRLPSAAAGAPGADDEEAARAYAELLDEMLLDRMVTDRELEDVASLAAEYGLSRRAAEAVHREYLENLIRYALLDDTITETERDDLRTVQRLLGLGDRDLEALVEDVRGDLEAAYGGDPGAVAPELMGASVCFTGSLQARIDGETVSRSTAQRLADERGMVVKKNVTKGLDYLVAADPHTQSNKAEKARRYGVPIVAELEFWRRLGVAVE